MKIQKTENPQRGNDTSTKSTSDIRTSMRLDDIRAAFLDNLFYVMCRVPDVATPRDFYMAFAYTVRDRMLQRWINTIKTWSQKRDDVKVVAYLSAEFLMGPQLGCNLINLGIFDEVRTALAKAGYDINSLLEQEEEPGLGNGGLGRLAACYLESLATMQIPAIGYGIRYEFGIFQQDIIDGWQIERTDKWLTYGNPWEIAHPELSCEVKFGGYTESWYDEQGRYRVKWVPERIVKGIPYDMPILGYRVGICNMLRLWKAEATESFDLQAFNVGDYYRAVEKKVISENLTKVLYPNDEPLKGKELRLTQQYFFVSCSLQDMIRIHLKTGNSLDQFDGKWAIQLNDTHPSIAVAEMMRLFVDEHMVDWETAWDRTTRCLCYTNHTLLSEALETWPLDLFARLLPRHLEIIYEINQRFLSMVRKQHPDDDALIARVSLIDEFPPRSVRMAHLACVGCHAINGVAELHTELLKQEVLPDFARLWPNKFSNKTNGVTPRRWLVLCNPRLSRLITSRIGQGWIRELERLRELEAYADDEEFLHEWQEVKLRNKEELATRIAERCGSTVNADSMFDVQVKRIHEYKRQHLNVLHIITLFNRIKRNPGIHIAPRTFVFGGKAAPGYYMAKLMIKLINAVADVVNRDADINGRLKVVFFPNFNVKNGQWIYPAADLSEQISTAGKEASGTGNMKFSMNGALTIGTLDGANIEIRQEVGEKNFFLFGLTAQEVYERKSRGYKPLDYYHNSSELRDALDLIASGRFSLGQSDLFTPLVNALLAHDDYMVLADYQSYIECQERVSAIFMDVAHWTRMSVLNVARIGKFSSDRAIQEYADDIWKVRPVPLDVDSL